MRIQQLVDPLLLEVQQLDMAMEPPRLDHLDTARTAHRELDTLHMTIAMLDMEVLEATEPRTKT
jgi:hypothetical protein